MILRAALIALFGMATVLDSGQCMAQALQAQSAGTVSQSPTIGIGASGGFLSGTGLAIRGYPFDWLGVQVAGAPFDSILSQFGIEGLLGGDLKSPSGNTRIYVPLGFARRWRNDSTLTLLGVGDGVEWIFTDRKWIGISLELSAVFLTSSDGKEPGLLPLPSASILFYLW